MHSPQHLTVLYCTVTLSGQLRNNATLYAFGFCVCLNESAGAIESWSDSLRASCLLGELLIWIFSLSDHLTPSRYHALRSCFRWQNAILMIFRAASAGIPLCGVNSLPAYKHLVIARSNTVNPRIRIPYLGQC